MGGPSSPRDPTRSLVRACQHVEKVSLSEVTRLVCLALPSQSRAPVRAGPRLPLTRAALSLHLAWAQPHKRSRSHPSTQPTDWRCGSHGPRVAQEGKAPNSLAPCFLTSVWMRIKGVVSPRLPAAPCSSGAAPRSPPYAVTRTQKPGRGCSTHQQLSFNSGFIQSGRSLLTSYENKTVTSAHTGSLVFLKQRLTRILRRGRSA